MKKLIDILPYFIVGILIGGIWASVLYEKEIQIIKNDCQIQSLLDNFDVLSNTYEK